MKLSAILATVATSISLSASAQQYHKDEFGHTVTDVPYQTSFDNTYGEYDGRSSLPVGWTCSGDNPFYTANTNDLPAADGTYYAISVNNSAYPRNERLYTLHFAMEAGRTYDLSFDLWMPGQWVSVVAEDGFADKEYRQPTFRLTAGEEQDYEFQTHELVSLTQATTGWKRVEAHFTPATAGNCCFCFAFNSSDTYTGDVAIDNLVLAYEGAVLRPVVDFQYSGLYNLMDGQLVCMGGGAVPFTSFTQHVTTYDWSVADGTGKTVATSTEPNPNFAFPASGTYTITLRGSNAEYSISSQKTIGVTCVTEGASLWAPLQTFSEQITDAYDVNKTPTLVSDGETDGFDFITGPNPYYQRFAERVEMPEGVEFSLQTLNYWLNSCVLASVTSGPVERSKAFRFAIYGEKNGRPNEADVIFEHNTTMGEAFSTNTSGLGGGTAMSLPVKGTTRGTFYVSFEFPSNLTLRTNGGNRTVVEMLGNHHRDNRTTLYYYSLAHNAWYPLDNLNESLAGTGLQLVLWGTLHVPAEGEGISRVEQTVLQSGATYDLAGRRVNSVSGQRGILINNGHKLLAR